MKGRRGVLPSTHFNFESVSQTDLKKFIRLLKRHRYTQEEFTHLSIYPFSFNPLAVPIVFFHFKNDLAAQMVYSLFYMGKAVDNVLLNKHLKGEEIALLERLNLIKKEKSRYRPLVSIVVYNSYYLTGDFLFYIDGSKVVRRTERNLVYPVSSDSVDLWKSVVKKKYMRALDLCTGCGFHAFLLSTISKKVIGSDINERAINFARFNALLNNVTNVEFVVSDLFDTLKKEQFDIIVANAPYVAAPTQGLTYHAGGPYGDMFTRLIIKGAHAFLAPQGVCYLVGFFYRATSGVFQKALRTPGIKQKAILFQFFKVTPYEYVRTYFRNRVDMETQMKETLTHFQAHKINTIIYGVFVFKRALKQTFSILPLYDSAKVRVLPSLIIKRHLGV